MGAERRRPIGAACVLACLLLLGACDGEGGTDDAIPADCGLPSPDPAARGGLIPAPFLLDGDALVATASRRKGGVTGVLNIRLSVADAFPIYKKAIRRAGFELVGEDNEGFEAELYMKRGKELGALQIRTSLCADAAVVFVNIVAGNFAMPIVTTPSPASP